MAKAIDQVAAMQRRQSVLDYLNAHPKSGFDDLLRALGHQIDEPQLCGALIAMVKRRELASSGPAKERIFIALKTVTMSVDEVLEAQRQRKRANYRRHAERISISNKNRKKERRATREAAPKPEQATANDAPGHYRHYPGKGGPLGYQGGQGACRPAVYVNCEQHY
jgi:hypothetical protein